MKKFGLMMIAMTALPAAALASTDISVPASMQICQSNADCTMVSNTCGDNCADLPVNKGSLAAIDTLKSQRCGGSASGPENQVCHTNPPMSSTCINNRCTVGYAFQHHADPQDYKSGAYPVPERATQPAPQTQSYNGVNDTDGTFSAYDMPSDQVRQNALGQYNFKQTPSATEDTATAETPATNSSVQ